MEIIRSIAVFAGWGLMGVAALFAVTVIFLMIRSRGGSEETTPAKPKGSSLFSSGSKAAKTKKPGKAKTLIAKGEDVTKEEATQRILGTTTGHNPLPTQLPSVAGIPSTRPPLPAQPVIVPSQETSDVPFVTIPSNLSEPPRL